MLSYREMMKVNVILPCGGSGSRCGLGRNKLLEPMLGDPLIMHTLRPFVANRDVVRIILACSKQDINAFDAIARLLGDSRIVTVLGGNNRAESVYNGINSLSKDCDIVVVHDGARPYLSDTLLNAVISQVASSGSAVAAIKVTDSLCYAENGVITHNAERTNCYRLQTPQAFRAIDIAKAFNNAAADGRLASYTDESSLMHAYGYAAQIICGDENNTKVTFKGDFHKVLGNNYRIGCGYDTHKLVSGRKLFIGGIELVHDKGLLGHSDADVLIHAVMDALLSCAGLRDIGVLFPDNDSKFKDIDSKILLSEVAKHLADNRLEIVNISAVVMAEKPKLARHIPAMAECMARILATDCNNINISATTCEGLGLVGHEEGISSRVVALCRIKEMTSC